MTSTRVRAAMAAVMLFGCGGSRGGTEPAEALDDGPIKECVALTNAYRSCLAQLGPTASDLASQHVATARAELESPPTSAAERASKRERCISGTKQLEAICR